MVPHKLVTAKPKSVTLTITKQQIAGIAGRQAAVNAAQAELNTFLSGVVAGHGYDVVQVTGLDDVKRTLTIIVPPKS